MGYKLINGEAISVVYVEKLKFFIKTILRLVRIKNSDALFSKKQPFLTIKKLFCPKKALKNNKIRANLLQKFSGEQR